MPVHLRALLVIMVLSAATFWVARRIACANAIDAAVYKRRIVVWFGITASAFVVGNYWLFVGVSAVLLRWGMARDPQPLALYCFTLFAIPPFWALIPGFGVFGDSFMDVTHLRWMAILVLLPLYLKLRSQPDVAPFGRTVTDKLVLTYLLMLVAIDLPNTSVTNAVRNTLKLFIDIFLPYYVASRSIKRMSDFRDVLMSLAVAVAVLAVLAVFESRFRWLLYSGVEVQLGLVRWGYGNTLNRGEGTLRAIVTAGHPIVLGYVMSVALVIFLALRSAVASRAWWFAGVALLFIGLVAAMSRGPWVGAAAMMCFLLVTGPKVASKLGLAAVAAVIGLPILLSTSKGQQILDYLPFIGTIESANVDFRQRLFDVAWSVIIRQPVFGVWGPPYHPDMEQLRGHDGLIDLVNAYVNVALSAGFVGLAIFLAPMVYPAVAIARSTWRQKDKQAPVNLLGRALVAIMLGTLVTIGTVSPILVIQIVICLLIGFSASYLRLVNSATVPRPAAPATPAAHAPRAQAATGWVPPDSRGPRPGAAHRR